MITTIFDKSGKKVAQYSSEEYVIVNEVNEIDAHTMFRNEIDLLNAKQRCRESQEYCEELSVILMGWAPKEVSDEQALVWIRADRAYRTLRKIAKDGR